MAKHALKPVRSTHSRLKLAVPMIVAGSLLSSAAAAYASPGPLQAPAPAAAPAASAFTPTVGTASVDITAPAAATLSFERPAVASTAAPKPAPTPAAPAVSQEKPAATPAPAATAQTASPATPVTPADNTAVNDVAAAAVGAGNPANIPGAAGSSASVNISTEGTGATDAFGQKIVAAALADAKANVQQDCTMLVTRSLQAVGISFHGWPKDYEQLGSLTTNPQPGDLIYYQNGGGAEGLAHIAVYIGNGLAVHGGWDGHNTKIFSVNVGSGPIYIHVNR